MYLIDPLMGAAEVGRTDYVLPPRNLCLLGIPTKSKADSHAIADATNTEGREFSLPERIHFHI